MNKKIPILLFLLIVLSSFVSAESFILDESRTRINYDPPGDNDELIYSGFEDNYIFKSGSLTLTRINNNFTSFNVFYSTGANTDDFFAFLYNATPLLNGGSLTQPSLLLTHNSITANDDLTFFEANIFGVNAVNNVNSINLNDVTPLSYLINDINGLEFDTQTNLLYVLYNSSRNVNVYSLSKPALWDASWLRGFTLDQNCGYTNINTIDIELLNNQFYLLCGDAISTPDRTIYSYSLFGDFRDTFTLNTLDNNYHSTTFTQDQNEMIVYDDTDNDIVFFAFEENIPIGEGVIVINGVAYNSSGLCINNDQYSTNASIFANQFGDIFFDSENQYIEWCSEGCINILDNNDVYQGVCSSGACFNECNQPNRDTCETPNTYGTCSIGGDGCLDLDSGLFCPANFVCEEDPLLGGDCVAIDEGELGDLWIQPFISIDITVNNTNAYEVLEQQIDQTIDVVTIPISTSLGIGVQSISNLFIKTLAQNFVQTVKITGVSQLQETTYYGLSCNFKDNYLELDYLETINDFATSDNITIDGEITYIDLTSTAIKTLEASTLSQKIEIMIDPQETGVYNIEYEQGNYGVLSLELTYNETSKNLLLRDTTFDKLIVNETGSALGNDTLERIVISTLHLKEADINNVQVIVIRSFAGVETEQIYFSLPIAYESGIASRPDTITFSSSTNSTLRLFQIIQREQSGFPTYNQNSIGTCEYTSLTCSNQVAFVNDRNVQTYYFQERLKTCISILGGATSVDPETQPPQFDGDLDFFEEVLGRELTRDGKLIFASVVLSLIFGIFVYGYIESKESIVLLGGTILTGLFLLWFSIIGYVPSWIIFVLIAIGGLIAVSFAKGGLRG